MEPLFSTPDPAEAERGDGALPATRLRRFGPAVIALFFLLNWVAWMLVPGSDLALARWIAAALALISGAGAVMGRGRGGGGAPGGPG